jgi:hypothetical protein
MSEHDRPRGNRKRGSEILRVEKLILTPRTKEYQYRTLVVSDDKNVYEYSKTTKFQCQSLFDWSKNWICIDHIPYIRSTNDWLEAKLAEGWRVPKTIRKFKTNVKKKLPRSSHGRLSGNFNPSLGTIIPTRPVDFIKVGRLKSVDKILDEAAQEDALNKELANKIKCPRCRKMIDIYYMHINGMCLNCEQQRRNQFSSKR